MERSNLKCRLLPPEPSRVAQLSDHLPFGTAALRWKHIKMSSATDTTLYEL